MARTVMKAAAVLYLIFVGLLFVLVLISREASIAPIIFCGIYCAPFGLYSTIKMMDLYHLEFPEEKIIWWGHAFSAPSSSQEESPELDFWQRTAAYWCALYAIPFFIFSAVNFSL